MYCRYCGAQIADDSVFCARCGRRLGRRSHPRLEKLVRRLRLNTPYPYFALVLIVFVSRFFAPGESPVDYSGLKVTLNVERNLDSPSDNFFQQSFSLHVENGGAKAIQRLPVELTARIEPAQPALVTASFRGQQLPIMEGGKPLPLVVVLSDQITPGAKHHFALGGAIQAQPPFTVTYEIRGEDSEPLLASYAVER
jgi:hypothetical protein